MDRGGIETWLMHLLRRVDRRSLAMDIACHSRLPGAYDVEIQGLGARLLRAPDHRQPWSYSRNFRCLVNDTQPYDVVHSHVHHYSGIVLRAATRLGVPVRIAHSHNDTQGVDKGSGQARSGYLRIMASLIERNATVGLAASRQSARALFGPNWESSNRWRVLHYGIDLAPFEEKTDRRSVRAEFGLGPEESVVVHVGRFVLQKNHAFLIDVARFLAKEPATRLLLVGVGPLKSDLEARVNREGLAGCVSFLGDRDDVARILVAADAFVLPSLYEGLPVALLEAQAAGLPCVISDMVSREAIVNEELITPLPLALGPEAWARTLASVSQSRPMSGFEALRRMAESDFTVDRSLARLQEFYGV